MSSIPTITLTDAPECAEQLLQAAQTLGFVYITLEGSGIPREDIDKMFQLSKDFFSLPTSEKATCAITANNKGWSGLQTETLDPSTQKFGDFKEAMNFGEFVNSKAQQPLPASLLPHEPFLARFQNLCHELSLKLLRLFAIALKIDASAGGADFFTPRHDSSLGPSGTILRLLYYSRLPASPPTDIRAGAHSDYGSLTLLFQREGQSGLEILRDGWKPVPAVEDAILVNIGDLLSYWTAGVLRSTVHRVVFPNEDKGDGEERYSMVYFCHPVNDTRLEAIPSEVVSSRGERGGNSKVVTAEEHLKERLAATYGWKEKAEK